MTRNHHYKARDFASLVTSTVHTETQVAVVENLLTQVQTALTSYTEASWASEHGWPDFADQVLDLAYRAKPGSDDQLAYVNALGADRAKERQRSCVLTPRHAQVLAALLDVTDPKQLENLKLSGLSLDNDLRWRIVIALATFGVKDTKRIIDAQSQKDPSDTGQLNAKQARAARPLAHNKETVWGQLMDRLEGKDSEIENNSDARAVVAGFAAPGQAELLAPFTARYFDSVVAVWKPGPIAMTIATGLYPSWDISRNGIDAADAVLDRGNVPGPLRRAIRDGQAEAKRALAARAVDAQP
jgi:aminopeptidase N